MSYPDGESRIAHNGSFRRLATNRATARFPRNRRPETTVRRQPSAVDGRPRAFRQ